MRDSKNLIEGKRVFCMGIDRSLVQDTLVDIEVFFKDTAGNNINCNYFKIYHSSFETQANASATTYSFIAEPVGVSKEGAYSDTGVVGFSENITSGVLGAGALGISDDVKQCITWRGSNKQDCNGVNLQIYPNFVAAGKDEKVFILIEYGNVFPYNPLRTDSYNLGL